MEGGLGSLPRAGRGVQVGRPAMWERRRCNVQLSISVKGARGQCCGLGGMERTTSVVSEWVRGR